MLEPEWTPWGPEHPKWPNCPVEPGTDCEVRFAGGSTTRGTMPESFEWWHESSCGDIIAYRVWPAKDEVRTAGHFIEDDARALLVEASKDCAKASEIVRLNLYRQSEKVEDAPRILDKLRAAIDAYLERNP